ncbi:MAG: hypothetical protein II980_04445 [Clostridia bacterium]|nr:hypothetical protein [Clostridia bacterium]
MRVTKNDITICLIGASGVGKSTMGAALTMNKHLAKNKFGTLSIKELKKDEVFKNMRKNIDKQFPTRHRVVHKSALSFKGRDNAWSTTFNELYLYDDRGGAYDSFLDLWFNPDVVALESSATNANSIICMLSSEQFFKSCKKYGLGCTPLMCQSCTESIKQNTDIDCKHLNRLAIKQMIKVIAKISIKNNIPVAIAITHSNIPEAQKKEKEMRGILSAYIDYEYASAPQLKPNIYFIDSKSAIENPKSKFARTVALPVLDLILKSLDSSTLQSSKNKVGEFFFNQIWGARNETYSDLRNTIITEIDTQGGY